MGRWRDEAAPVKRGGSVDVDVVVPVMVEGVVGVCEEEEEGERNPLVSPNAVVVIGDEGGGEEEGVVLGRTEVEEEVRAVLESRDVEEGAGEGDPTGGTVYATPVEALHGFSPGIRIIPVINAGGAVEIVTRRVWVLVHGVDVDMG
jgi:hypothetical protein